MADVLKENTERRVMRAMLWIQCTAAALLLADLAFTWTIRGLNRAQLILLAVCVLWLAAGAALLLTLRRFDKRGEKYGNAVTCATSLLVAFAVVELGLSLILPSGRGYLYPPKTRAVLVANEKFTPGIRGTTIRTYNESGLRGPSIAMLADRPDAMKIITVGGSTTICDLLDDSTEWPHLLMQDLNAAQSRVFAYVANAGVNGHNTADHLELLKSFPVVRQADLLTFLVGVNDLTATLAFEGRSAQAELAAHASSESFGPRYPFYKRLHSFRLLASLTSWHVGEWYAERRRLRAQSPVVPMPSLETGLAEYRARIQNIAEYCRSNGLRCVFLTQPVMWRENLTAAEERLIWLGSVGRMENPKGYVRIADLANGMDRFNQALLDTCGAKGLECYDLASSIPKDTTAFYDDCHFNDGGARLVARFLADRLVTTAPFVRKQNVAQIFSSPVGMFRSRLAKAEGTMREHQRNRVPVSR